MYLLHCMLFGVAHTFTIFKIIIFVDRPNSTFYETTKKSLGSRIDFAHHCRL